MRWMRIIALCVLGVVAHGQVNMSTNGGCSIDYDSMIIGENAEKTVLMWVVLNAQPGTGSESLRVPLCGNDNGKLWGCGWQIYCQPQPTISCRTEGAGTGCGPHPALLATNLNFIAMRQRNTGGATNVVQWYFHVPNGGSEYQGNPWSFEQKIGRVTGTSGGVFRIGFSARSTLGKLAVYRVLVFNRALSHGEVKSLFNCDGTIIPPGCVANAMYSQSQSLATIPANTRFKDAYSDAIITNRTTCDATAFVFPEARRD